MRRSFILFGFLSLFCGKAFAQNPFNELLDWTFQQNVGITLLYENHEWKTGAKWQFFQTGHEWLMAGLAGDGTPSLGGYVSFNLWKLVEKIKGAPLVYLRHLEVGYSYRWRLDGEDTTHGWFLNAIKWEF